jgi:hypothetical protein
MSRLGEKLTGDLLLALACWDGKCLRENNRGLDGRGGFVSYNFKIKIKEFMRNLNGRILKIR